MADTCSAMGCTYAMHLRPLRYSREEARPPPTGAPVGGLQNKLAAATADRLSTQLKSYIFWLSRASWLFWSERPHRRNGAQHDGSNRTYWSHWRYGSHWRYWSPWNTRWALYCLIKALPILKPMSASLQKHHSQHGLARGYSAEANTWGRDCWGPGKACELQRGRSVVTLRQATSIW
jgi:hypothetical protein